MEKYKPHLYKCTEWEGGGLWFCADTSDLVHDSSNWYVPCRVLGVSPAEFVRLLKEKYNCDIIKWTAEEPCMLFYCWSNQSDMRKFKNDVNKAARDRHFLI